MPAIPVKIMMNVGNPDRAFDFATIPNDGVGLARLEFIINNMIGIHPKALLEFDRLPKDLQAQIMRRIAGYPSPREFYVDKIAEGSPRSRRRSTQARDRSPVRLQVERVCEPDRRRSATSRTRRTR